MAHIPDGVVALPVLLSGAAVTGAGVCLALRRLEAKRIPQVAVLSSVFFVASLVSVPIGPSAVHPLLGGLMGMVLGWAAFPAVLVALILQTVMFGFGGITTLGLNAMNIALPAVLVHLAFGRALRAAAGPRAAWCGAAAGAAAVLLTSALVALSLWLSGREFQVAAKILGVAYLPLMLVEAALTGAAVALLRRVKPELLQGAVRLTEAGRA